MGLDFPSVVKSPGCSDSDDTGGTGIKQFSPTGSVPPLRGRSTVGSRLQVPIEPVYRRRASNPQGAKDYNALRESVQGGSVG